MPNGLTEQAIAAARNIRFEPAKKNGVAYTVTQQIQYTFTLDDRKTEPSNITPISWSYLADDANGSVGQRFTFKCLPNPNGEIGIHVSGTDVYHTYSPICWAAVHAGIITPDLGGVVTFEIRAGQAAYIGSKRNGIQSDDYNTSAPRSFVFIKN